MQHSLHRGVAVAPEPMAALASMTVQPRRVVSSCLASIGIARVCWSWGDTRAWRATRRGDTKPPCKMGKATLELPGGRVLQIWDDTPLVLCQDERSQGTPGAHASRLERSRLPRGLWGCPCLASRPRRASATRGQAALWETGSGQRRFPSRGVVLSDAVAMRCARLTAAFNRAHHDPYLTGTRPGVTQRTCLLSCLAPLSSCGPAGGARQ